MKQDFSSRVFLDCTLRDGGYYNSWDFSPELVDSYLASMRDAGVNVVELGLRSLINHGFKGAAAYCTDGYIESLGVPRGLDVCVMINASELLESEDFTAVLAKLFPRPASTSPVSIVRVACHVHEFRLALPASQWLKDMGYIVGFNLMQIADQSQEEVESLSKEASNWPLDVLYFADSMGSMGPEQCSRIIGWLRTGWLGSIGIHTHDNLGLALSNTLKALENGVTWVDATVTGMGRGPGNARTEELAIELASLREEKVNLVPLMTTIRETFKPMQEHYGWGTNPYYYLAGKYAIHPSYIQVMLSDNRYDDEDILAVIEHLRVEGGKKYSLATLDGARHFYQGDPCGKWSPASMIKGREVLLLGTGPGVSEHRSAIETYINEKRPLVMALNTQSGVDADLIDVRVACHPVRLLADCEIHSRLPQPLITPISMLPDDVKLSLEDKDVFDFGLSVARDTFNFEDNWCTLPTSLVIAYALAVLASGGCKRVLMAGFDGYASDDPRNREMNGLIKLYQEHPQSSALVSVTPTRYELETKSIYGIF